MSAGEAVRIQASHGKVALLSADQRITVINTHGTQVIDTWAFNAHDLGEHMTMPLPSMPPDRGNVGEFVDPLEATR